MVQSIGICMILAVTTLTGAYFCLREKYRLQDLRELERAMVMMESQIRFLSVPLSEVLENISYQTGGQVGMLMEETAKAMAERTGETAEQIWEAVWDAAYIPYLFVGRRLSKHFALWQNIGVFGSGTAEKQYRAVFDGIAAEMRTD